MPKFAANISMMYQEHPFLERMQAAAQDGFRAIECQFPYEHSIESLKAALDASGLEMILLNTPPGNFAAGDRGTAVDPKRKQEFRDGLDKSIAYAQALRAKKIHVMAGIAPNDADAARVRDVYVQNIAWAAEQLKRADLIGLIEPINTRDIPGYYLNHQSKAHAVVNAIGSAHLKVQMDLYHLQIVEGDVASKIAHFLPTGNVGHVQIAGVPSRNEPDVGELNYPFLFAQLDALGYHDWIGAEYKPKARTSDGLAWVQPYLRRS
jgi:2-dehydrotetronate isomerase